MAQRGTPQKEGSKEKKERRVEFVSTPVGGCVCGAGELGGGGELCMALVGSVVGGRRVWSW